MEQKCEQNGQMDNENIYDIMNIASKYWNKHRELIGALGAWVWARIGFFANYSELLKLWTTIAYEKN